MRLLIVEDQRELAETLRRALESRGFAVDLAFDGEEGDYKAGLTPYDAIILDIGLPGIDGLELCRRLRASGSKAAILMLTARDRIADRVLGLDVGADDYLVKPFSLDELSARLRALLRRTATRSEAPIVLHVGRLAVDPSALTATFDGRPLSLTVREFAVLEYLARRSPAVASPEELLEHVWDEHCNPFTNTIRVHLANLRRKLREVSGDNVIETVVGKGYRLCAR
jgi:DNA-binding response OmpR family regulator